MTESTVIQIDDLVGNAFMNDWLARTHELAQAGRTAYQIQLGQSYLIGQDFEGNQIPKDYDQARKWLERAHSKGAVTATYILGTIYENGLGVPENFPAAIEHYTIAAERGSYLACLSLARIYARETGDPRSHEHAVKWYSEVLRFEGDVDDVAGIDEAHAFFTEHAAR